MLCREGGIGKIIKFNGPSSNDLVRERERERKEPKGWEKGRSMINGRSKNSGQKGEGRDRWLCVMAAAHEMR
jgi:hypothetical protein